MVNTPIPHSLKSECKKAAKILRDFSFPSAKSGPDKLIPAGIIAKAKGLAILTVVKAGFLVTARGGSGIVLAKLEDDLMSSKWSAPSAIGIAGLGGGFEIGAEVTDFVIILNSQSAVDAFSKGGNLTLGGNFTIAAGPLGRNIEGDVAVRSPAAIYTYSRTKGLFAGISVEGSALIERKDANRKFYGQDIRAFSILSGDVPPPGECEAVYKVLQQHREMAAEAAFKMAKAQARKHGSTVGEAISEKFHSLTSRSDDKKAVRKTSTTTVSTVSKDGSGRTVVEKTMRTTTVRSYKSGPTLSSAGAAGSVCKAVAIATYRAQLPGDLSLDIGDEIDVVTRTESDFDWWEGVCNDKLGIFPANHVRVVGG